MMISLLIINYFFYNKNLYIFKIKNKIECPICYEEINEKYFFITKCNHKFCKNCIIKQYKLSNIITCALCRTNITPINFYQINNYDNLFLDLQYLFLYV